MGRKKLHEDLQKVDPQTAQKIPPGNIQRVIRALEIYQITGKPISEIQRDKTKPSPFPFSWVGLFCQKETLTNHLKRRCQKMIEGGMVEEVENLIQKGISANCPALQGLGYHLVIDFLAGKINHQELTEKFFHETKLYAKRQLTWFKSNPRIKWFEYDPQADPTLTAVKIHHFLREKHGKPFFLQETKNLLK